MSNGDEVRTSRLTRKDGDSGGEARVNTLSGLPRTTSARREPNTSTLSTHILTETSGDDGGANCGGRSSIFDGNPSTSTRQETWWRDRQLWLAQRGHMLRPRYIPDWKPFWKGTKKPWYECEDGLMSRTPDVLDATRISDGKIIKIRASLRNRHRAILFHRTSSLRFTTFKCL